MNNEGRYADGRHFSLPDGWPPLLDEVLEAAVTNARAAVFGEDVQHRLDRYYSRSGNFAGTSFLDVEPNTPNDIVAGDLYAVSRLSMNIRNDQGRLLLDSGPERSQAVKLLRAVSPDATIVDLSAELLTAMWLLYDHFRSLLSTDTRISRHWVFAAKLCARKRPGLFPIRDGEVTKLLSGKVGTTTKPEHRLGRFSNDIQLSAFLTTDAGFSARLLELQADCAEKGLRVDEPPLRFLDVLLWTRATSC